MRPQKRSGPGQPTGTASNIRTRQAADTPHGIGPAATPVAVPNGVLIAPAVQVVPADQRRMHATYVVECPRGCGTHLHRSDGIREAPCGSYLVVVAVTE